MSRAIKPIMNLSGILLILLGIISFFNPIGLLQTIGIYIGIAFFAVGITYVFNFIKEYNRERPVWMLTRGLTDILFGALLMLNGSVFAFSISYLIAIWAFVTGTMRIATAIELKRSHYYNWSTLFGFGMVSLIFAVLVFTHPVIGAGLVAFCLGIMFISMGIGSLTEGSML